jgi:hypothetical protein
MLRDRGNGGSDGGRIGGGRTGRVAFRPTATATTHDRGGYGRPGRDIELVARGGRATSIDSSAPETKARRGGLRRRRPSPPGRALTFHPLRVRAELYLPPASGGESERFTAALSALGR